MASAHGKCQFVADISLFWRRWKSTDASLPHTYALMLILSKIINSGLWPNLYFLFWSFDWHTSGGTCPCSSVCRHLWKHSYFLVRAIHFQYNFIFPTLYRESTTLQGFLAPFMEQRRQNLGIKKKIWVSRVHVRLQFMRTEGSHGGILTELGDMFWSLCELQEVHFNFKFNF